MTIRAVVWLLIYLACSQAVGSSPAAAVDRLAAARSERVLLHGNRLRGLAYVPLAQPDAQGDTEPAQFAMAPALQIPFATANDRSVNVRGNVLPVDGDGDGIYEFLHYNGYRLFEVYSRSGVRLWHKDNPKGRIHRSFVHRDSVAVLDTGGDRRQEILHCWVEPGSGKRTLVRRDGATGEVLASSAAIDSVGAECQIAVFRFAGVTAPILLLARKAPASAGCTRNFVDEWSTVTAYDVRQLKPLWTRTTCNAGHYVWPLDANGDGAAEAVFIGKYLYDATGRLICTLGGWGTDHVDSLAVGDFSTSLAGVEVLAVGATGTRFYSAAGCTARWTIGNAVIQGASRVAAVRLDPTKPPSMVVQAHSTPLRFFHLNALGVVSSYPDPSPLEPIPQQNANLDGATTREDLLAWFGQVVDAAGKLRLSVDWYWNLQTLLPEEQSLNPYNKWASADIAFDLDGDGRDELIVWGRERIVVGALASGRSTPVAAAGSTRPALAIRSAFVSTD